MKKRSDSKKLDTAKKGNLKKQVVAIFVLIIFFLIILGVIILLKNTEKSNKVQDIAQKEEAIIIDYEIKSFDKEKAHILITVTSNQGIEKITKPDNSQITPVEYKNKIALDFTVEDAVNYKFVVTSLEGITVEKIINIDIITVSFETNGGNTIDSIPIIKGETLSKLPSPKKTNYTFDGWYYNDEKITQITPSTDVIVTAKWIEGTYLIKDRSDYSSF